MTWICTNREILTVYLAEDYVVIRRRILQPRPYLVKEYPEIQRVSDAAGRIPWHGNCDDPDTSENPVNDDDEYYPGYLDETPMEG